MDKPDNTDNATNTGREYRFQKDITIGHSMYHVRCDDWEDFVASVRKIEALIQEEKPAAKEVSTGAMVADSVVCAQCGAPVGPEKTITWKDSLWWVRECSTGQKHKTGFFRKASN